MNSIFYKSSRLSASLAYESLRRILCIYIHTYDGHGVGIKSTFRTMSFLKSRLLPLPLSFLCSPGGGGGILIVYYMCTLDSHNSSSFTTGRRRRPSPRYFYDIFSTLYRFFLPRPRVFFKLCPFFRYVQTV